MVAGNRVCAAVYRLGRGVSDTLAIVFGILCAVVAFGFWISLIVLALQANARGADPLAVVVWTWIFRVIAMIYLSVCLWWNWRETDHLRGGDGTAVLRQFSSLSLGRKLCYAALLILLWASMQFPTVAGLVTFFMYWHIISWG